MNSIEHIIDGIIEREGNGAYTNGPNDSGGPTRWGITERVARENNYHGDMRNFPREASVRILLAKYWTGPGFSLVHDHHQRLAVRLADFGVLAGPKTSSLHLQRCLCVLNRGGAEYPDIEKDGVIGKKTIDALKSFLKLRGAQGCDVILGMVTSLQSAYLIELAERRPKDEEYEYGWQLNRGIGALLFVSS